MSHSPLLPYAWRDRAACRDADPGLWFPEGAPAPDAVRVCAGCRVRRPCLLDALREEGPSAGVRAGLDEDDRAPLHRAYAAWRTAVATDHAALRAAERAAVGAELRRAVRALADAAEAEADALTGYVLAVAAVGVPLAEWEAARAVHGDAVAATRRAEAAAGAWSRSAATDRARCRLLAAAHHLAVAALTLAPAPAPASVPVPVPAPAPVAGASVAGAA